MATTFTALLVDVRNRLIEPVPKFWSDAELTEIAIKGARDLWRDVVDLKQEHYLTIDTTNVSYVAGATTLTGVPADVHKILMIEPRDLSVNGANHGLLFKPLEYQNNTFQLARSRDAIDPTNDTLYYAIMQQGTPIGPPTIVVAPKVTSTVLIAFSYVPSLGALTGSSYIPIPGEADAAIVAYTVAFARAKERDDRSPDPAWLAIYATEKAHLLQSLGLREYQDPSYSEALWVEYW
jgi:hypothetical protein